MDDLGNELFWFFLAKILGIIFWTVVIIGIPLAFLITCVSSMF